MIFFDCPLYFLFHLIDSTDVSGLVNSSNKVAIESVTIENIIPSNSSSVIDYLMPIVSLLLGFFLGKVYDSIDSRIKLKNEGKLWFETFLQLGEPLKKQVINISKFIESSNLDSHKLDTPEFQMPLNCLAFDSLNEKAIIPFCQKKRKISYKKAIKIAGQSKNTVGLIKQYSSKYSDSFIKYTDKSSVIFKVFSEEFKVFRKYMGDYVDKIERLDNSTTTQQDVAYKLSLLHNEYIGKAIHTDEPINIYVISKGLFTKVLEVVHPDRYHPDVIKLIESLTICDQAVMDIKMERRYLFEYLSLIKAGFERAKNSIEQIEKKVN